MYWLLAAVYAAHVLAAVVWFGGGLTSMLVTGPALQAAGPGGSGVSAEIGKKAHSVYPLAGTLTIVLGVLAAIFVGRITSPGDLLASPYGLTVLLALLLSVGIWIWGQYVVGPQAVRIQTAPPEQRAAVVGKLLQFLGLEMFGFIAVFICMVLMRFGL